MSIACSLIIHTKLQSWLLHPKYPTRPVQHLTYTSHTHSFLTYHPRLCYNKKKDIIIEPIQYASPRTDR